MILRQSAVPRTDFLFLQKLPIFARFFGHSGV